ncbi:MAG: hypothetical protein OES84_00045 [Kiritimatiellaceae bacterium]|nr:hypothetical protein [Kiritimatiellaceae bacterium]
MPAAAAAVGIGTIGAAYIGKKATEEAADVSATAQREAIAESRRQFDIGREDLAPYREIGAEALETIRNVFINGDMDEFYESPGYRFNLEQGEQALERKQGQAGARFGGRSLKETARFSQGLASNEFNNFFNRLSGIANIGQSAAAGSANLAASAGATNAGLIQSGGATQANLALQGGQSLNQALQGGIGNLVTLNAYNDLTKALQPQAITTIGGG